ncbi:MAG: UDP-N-acetylmuramate--L-alanine ligase, partial [Firmicutes bacterium]|nr:UDP-N-acetylmuramate--L-alanine ligase [Bacillota bacterium]
MSSFAEPFVLSSCRHVHFVGIGGISMSGLARILAARGYKVTGCDRKESPLIRVLRNAGIQVAIGHDPSHLEGVDLVVYTAAIRPEEPELLAARDKRIKIIERAGLLGAISSSYPVRIAVAGTHGKTTTTGMIGFVLAELGLDPTVTIGGELPQLGGNLRLGGEKIFLTEACEYVESFLRLAPTIAVVLNIEPDHPDFFRDLAHLREAFTRFVGLVPPEGVIVARTELPNVAAAGAEGARARVVSFGEGPEADFTAAEVEFDGEGRPWFTPVVRGKPMGRLRLGVPGVHNILNALAALAVVQELGVDPSAAAEILARYNGTKRRFERKGFYAGAAVVDDYAHHPTEIRATINTARNCSYRRIWCVFQPHTYSRTAFLLDEFARALSLADRVIVTDIYAAREKDDGRVHARDLVARVTALGKEAIYLPSFAAIVSYLRTKVEAGDLVLTMGAGDVDRVGEML